jgi:hypothetical protein
MGKAAKRGLHSLQRSKEGSDSPFVKAANQSVSSAAVTVDLTRAEQSADDGKVILNSQERENRE